MAITAAALAAGANKQLEVYATGEPVDQVNKERPFMQWLVSKKAETIGGNEYFNEKVHVSNDSNYQNYKGDDQVSYNRRDTVRLAKFPWANFHDGFALNEDELAANGITMTDDTTEVASDAELIQIYNILEQNYADLKAGVQEKFDEEMHRDGTHDSKAAQGLDFLVSTTPAVGTVGGIDAATNTYWRNSVNLNIPAATDVATAEAFLAALETTWRAAATYGKMVPDKIFAGAAFIDAYRKAVRLTNGIQVVVKSTSGSPGVNSFEGGTGDLFFHNVLIEWDPTFETLDALYGPFTVPWTKRAYFLNSKTIKLRPLKGHWMVNRKPPRMYDRYVFYFGMTSKYRLTINKRNANAVVSVA